MDRKCFEMYFIWVLLLILSAQLELRVTISQKIAHCWTYGLVRIELDNYKLGY